MNLINRPVFAPRALGLAALLLASAATAQDFTIVGFDALRGGPGSFSAGSFFSTFRASLTTQFPGVTLRGITSLTSLDRAIDDVVVVSSITGSNSAITPLTSAEQAALLAFVTAGGGALVLVDNDTFAGGNSDAANESIINPFGMDITGTGAAWPRSANVTAPDASPVTNGRFGRITQFTVGWSGWFDGPGPYATYRATLADNNQPCLAIIPCGAISPGSGPVVLLADSTFAVTGYVTANNLNLLGNAVDYARTFAIAEQPRSTTVCRQGLANMSVRMAGPGPYSYQWQIENGPGNWQGLGNDPMPLRCGGYAFASPINSPDVNIGVHNCEGIFRFRCLVTNACGSTLSSVATYEVCPCPGCVADFNEDGGVDGSDVSAFFDRWETGSCAADVNADGGVDGSDIESFFLMWENGGC